MVQNATGGRGLVRRRRVKKVILINFMLVIAAAAASGLSAALGEAKGSNTTAAIMGIGCAILMLRVPAAFLEWYMARRGALRSILVAHILALYFAAFAGLTRPAPTTPNAGASGDAVLSGGLDLILGIYFLTALICLSAAALFVLVRQIMHHDESSTARRLEERVSLRSLVGWGHSFRLNAVLIAATAVIVAPSFAKQANESFVYGLFGGGLVALMLRVPGVWAESYLTRHRLHRGVYWAHLVSGVLTGVVILGNLDSSTNPSHSTLDTVVIAVCAYLFLSSLGVSLVVAVSALVRVLRGLAPGKNASESSRTVAAPSPRTADLQEPAAAHNRAGSPTEVLRDECRGQEAIVIASPQPGPDSAVPATPLMYGPDQPEETGGETQTSESPARVTRTPRDEDESASRSIRNQVGLVLGIVTGLASLVQGFNSADPYRTSIGAVAVGFIGLALIFLLTGRGRS